MFEFDKTLPGDLVDLDVLYKIAPRGVAKFAAVSELWPSEVCSSCSISSDSYMHMNY